MYLIKRNFVSCFFVTKRLPASLAYAFSQRNGMKFSAAALFVAKRLPANLVYTFSQRNGMKFFCGDSLRGETASCKFGLYVFMTKTYKNFPK
ncbi:MAG: hypothetical protein LBS55_00330 [Prevotellaceae bacterium]|jgi:hypothetical protein|nr:hypothetical protein [Prevotellaceae bacterium]